MIQILSFESSNSYAIEQSMYGIFTYIWLIFMVNVGKYTIHGCSGDGSSDHHDFRIIVFFGGLQVSTRLNPTSFVQKLRVHARKKKKKLKKTLEVTSKKPGAP